MPRSILDEDHLHPAIRDQVAASHKDIVDEVKAAIAAHDVVVSLSKGASSTFSPRTMMMGSEVLSYNLYRDAARTSIWGDGTAGTSTYTNANPPNNTAINITVYGRVPAGQDVSAGAYSDTVSAVINF